MRYSDVFHGRCGNESINGPPLFNAFLPLLNLVTAADSSLAEFLLCMDCGQYYCWEAVARSAESEAFERGVERREPRAK